MLGDLLDGRAGLFHFYSFFFAAVVVVVVGLSFLDVVGIITRYFHCTENGTFFFFVHRAEEGQGLTAVWTVRTIFNRENRETRV